MKPYWDVFADDPTSDDSFLEHARETMGAHLKQLASMVRVGGEAVLAFGAIPDGPL